MKTNRPIREKIIKRGDDSAARIRKAVNPRKQKVRDDFRKADEKIEKLKE